MLVVTHFVAMLLPIAAFLLAFGWFVAEPPIEIGPLIFTCDAKPTLAGQTVYGCFGALR